ncbi:serine/threonine-protein kinase, partial [archaeon]
MHARARTRVPCMHARARLRADVGAVQKRIGVGSRGQVFQANSGDGKIVAVKVMNREDDETNVEITAISRLQPHPHIIAMLGSVEYSADSAFLVLEFCETDLLEVVTARGGEGLPEDVASAYFLQLVKALRHSHKRGVYHGDIKPENCLIQGADLKLCDFGSASLQRMSTRATGSVLYAAPEVVPYLAEHSDASPLAPGAHEAAATLKAAGMLGVHDVVRYDAAAADCWSLGVVLFVMLAGRPPFAEATLYDAEFVKLVQNEFDFPPHFSNDAVRLLRFILRVPPAERPTISDILRDPWVTPFSEARASINVMQRRMTRQHHGGDRLHGSRHHR